MLIFELVKPTLPHDYIDKTMDKLCMAVVAIHSTKAVPDSLEELYKVFLLFIYPIHLG